MIAVHSMPGTQLTDTPIQPSIHAAAPAPFKNVSYKPLHLTFGAEVIGFDFDTVDEDKVAEIKRALAIVSRACIHTTGLNEQSSL